mmetsp:Transcript_10135/g.18766  ORF Transcript_10135/g.18766 Transcript_10135/m.18766 type:complete len:162 (-) Transcript_10135:350-835(-)
MLASVRSLSSRVGLQAVSRASYGPLYHKYRFMSTDEDSHSDFKPQVKAVPVGTIEEQIKASISRDNVHVFMKGTPEQPQCGFSRMACAILNAYGVKYGATNVLADPEIREGIKEFSSWPTIPQVFIKGEFIGGADIMYNMHESGELMKMLQPILEEQEAKK